MTIKIIPEKEVNVTQAEYDRLARECEKHNQYTTQPLSIEEYIRRHKDTPNHAISLIKH